MSRIKIYHLGCIAGLAKAIQLIDLGKKYGIELAEAGEETDNHLIITCMGTGVTIQSFYDIMEDILNRINDKEKIIIVGCFNKEGEYLKKMFEGQQNIRVIEDENWPRPVINEIMGLSEKTTERDILDGRKLPIFNNSDGNPSEVVIKYMIEDGCTNRCSFCKNNYIKDPTVKSISEEVVLKYLREKIAAGTRQIILGGENTTLYGIDLYGRRTLHSLIRKLSEEEGLEYISVDELTVANMYPELFEELLNNPKVTSMQFQLESASNKILKLMNRGHTIQTYDDYIAELMKKGKYIGTILMSGYPGETYDDLDETIEYMQRRGIYTVGISEYEDHHCLPSSKKEQLPDEEKRNHTNYLAKAITENNYRVMVGSMQTIETAILTAKFNGYYIFSTPNTCSGGGYGIGKDFADLEPGAILKIKPKSIDNSLKVIEKRGVYRF